MGYLTQYPTTSFLGTIDPGRPNLFTINYDLRVHGQDYAGLTAQIEKMGGIRVQQSMWMISSYLAQSVQVRDMLLPFIDGNDSIVVTRVVDIAGWEGNPRVRAWIQAILKSVLA